MKKVLILVEGQTEETFVKRVLYDHLLGRDICIVPKLVTTKQAVNGMKYEGGYVKYSKVKKRDSAISC